MGEENLRELVAGFVAGDRDAAERLVDDITPILLALLRKHLGGQPIAHELEDIVQDAWLNAFRHRHRYDGTRAGFATWIARIALNLAIERYKKALRNPARVVYDPPDEVSNNFWGDGDEPSPRSTYAPLHRALLDLPQEDQKMLEFYSTYEGEDWQAAYARITGMNRNTLRSRFARALQKLRDAMGRPDEEEDQQ
jgi:RNA polymerase sigma-70 factor (ECF subfamily)